MAAEKKLSDRKIQNTPPGRLYDGGGLIFVKSKKSAKWVYRFTFEGKRHDMGLGAYPYVSLAKARKQRDFYRDILAAGQDPIRERNQKSAALNALDNTFHALVYRAFEAKKAEFKDDGKAGRWLSPLETHIIPKLGQLHIEDINQLVLCEALRPLWHTKSETARKALNRIGIVLRYAAAEGLAVNLNAVPLVKELLGKTRHAPQKMPALDWRDVPEFYQSLSEDSPVQLALKLLILTASRSKPVRYLQEDHIVGDIWTIPGELMKGRKGSTSSFRIPLSNEALNVIQKARAFERDGYLFPGLNANVLSDASMARLMQRRGMTARPHGFRSSCETWLAEYTTAIYELQKMVLGHSIGDKVYRAYQRSDLLDQRRAIMDEWSDFLRGENKIIKLRI